MIEIFIGYINIHGSRPSAPKGNRKRETLLVKTFIVKKKTNAIEKIKVFSSIKQATFPLDKELQRRNVKQKPFKQI